MISSHFFKEYPQLQVTLFFNSTTGVVQTTEVNKIDPVGRCVDCRPVPKSNLAESEKRSLLFLPFFVLLPIADVAYRQLIAIYLYALQQLEIPSTHGYKRRRLCRR